ncbi:hypothetical protein [Alteromonas gracilis]|uniref:hypothetical protein n=1 Tax=Alteromonas gracilis TaxID=1479524 RepID=UPI002FDFC82C
MKNDKDKCELIIATNAPEYFNDHENYKFIALGADSDQKASYVVLMLQTNWNVKSVEQIEALTHHVSAYPKHTPAVIIGAEFQFPTSVSFEKIITSYRNVRRDNAVAELCNTVLTRSDAIGVRGSVTKDYLVRVLNFAPEKIEVVYDSKELNSKEKLIEFVNKNIPVLKRHVNDVLRFQKKPKVFKEYPVNFDKNLEVGKPFLERNGDAIRLCINITVNNKRKCLWVETDKQYADFLTVDRIDPFLLVLIPFAMRNGHDIVSQSPVSDRLMYNVQEVLIPNLCAGDRRLHYPNLCIDTCGSALPSGKLIATGMSCGIDSFYSAMEALSTSLSTHKLNALYCGNYLYGNEGLIFERARHVTKQLDLRFVSTSTNINQELGLPHIETHFYKTLFGVIALRQLFKMYYYSSAGNFTGFSLERNGSNDTALYELLLLYVFSDENFQILSGGGGITRVEKTRRLVDFAPAQRYLNVCVYPNNVKNCGKCGKCLRTLLTLDMLGALDKFNNVFDISEYKDNREEHMRYLKGRADDYMLREVYEHFLV